MTCLLSRCVTLPSHADSPPLTVPAAPNRLRRARRRPLRLRRTRRRLRLRQELRYVPLSLSLSLPASPLTPHTPLPLPRQIPPNAAHPRRIDLRPARTHGTRIPAPDLRQEAGQDGAVGADGGGQRLRRQPAAIRARLAVRPRRALTLSVWVSLSPAACAPTARYG